MKTLSDELVAQLKDLQAAGIAVKIDLSLYVELDEKPEIPPVVDEPPVEEPPVEEPPAPPVIEVPYKVAQVTAEKAILFYVKDFNKNGKPIMEMYGAPGTPQRKRFDFGATLKVFPNQIIGDGAIAWYQAVDFTTDDGKPLYVEAKKVKLL